MINLRYLFVVYYCAITYFEFITIWYNFIETTLEQT